MIPFKCITFFEIAFSTTRSDEFDNILDVYSDENECVSAHVFVATMRTKAEYSDETSLTMDVVIGVRTKFSIIEPGKILIRRNDVVSVFEWDRLLYSCSCPNFISHISFLQSI